MGDSETADNSAELKPSKLGTKEHWDEVYKEELKHYEDDKVEGEDWFGPAIKTKIVQYMEKKMPNLDKNDPIIDLGCGCGSVLVEMHESEFTNLTGVDYSENAIELCRAVALDNQMSANLKVFDLINGPVEELGKFKVCTDKGTYDAISLMPGGSQMEARNKYLKNVASLLRNDGVFILASCNWTSAELQEHTKEWFEFVEDIPTSKFSFGGKTGSDVAIVVLKKNQL